MTSRQANVLTGVGLAALLVAVSLTAPRWSGLLREPAAVLDDDSLPAEPTPSPEGAEAARRINVRLYFVAPESEGATVSSVIASAGEAPLTLVAASVTVAVKLLAPSAPSAAVVTST